MKINRLNIIILLGLVATVGILVAQLFWTFQSFSIEQKKFNQTVHLALQEVARKIYKNNNHEFSTKDLIQKVSDDYYVVNVNDDIQPEILEHFLKTEFTKFNIITDFEYAIYNCESDEMMYGNYISINSESESDKEISFPKYKDLIYYFAIRFPNEKSYLIGSLQFWFILSGALIVILLIYVYSIYTLIQQKKYSELQRDFINNMTHEFKTPLSSILLASNYINNQEVVKQDSKLSNYTSIIINQGKKLNNHIEKILNIAKSDVSALALHPVKLELHQSLRQITDSYLLKNENLKIELDISKNQTIVADEFHFGNIVQNLIDNSIKYSDENSKMKIYSIQNSKGIQLNFTDNGVGVPPKSLSFIFDKFYRVSNRKSNEVNGFGLGLYYVKKIVQQHNWKIWASNNLDEGLTISILIPKK
ncbi:MAG: sensor histidine kinase [Moheibacter sp.]